MATILYHVRPPIGSASQVFSPRHSNNSAVGDRRRVTHPPTAVAAIKASPPVVIAPSLISANIIDGYEDLSKMGARFIGALFLYMAGSIFSIPEGATSCPPRVHSISCAIHSTRLPVVVFIAPFLPTERCSIGQRHLIIASKEICDDTYSNKSWCIVGQNLYTLKEVNQMEREMCSYLFR